ncbi:MAG: DDE transposase [Planctomycetota bacterium]|nr:MAG: DDE transposase [Planctomycetota bacterium]
MAMGRRKKQAQSSFWIATADLPKSGGHPFYEQVNRILEAEGFDGHVEALCAPFYADGVGRPSLAPAVYFRLLLVGYFEGLDSERGIAWRTADSLALRSFLGFGLTDATPDHSTISRNRRLIDLETHQAVFTWVLQVLARNRLLKGKTLGIDATTLEANAALRSMVRRDTGEGYQEFLARLAQESGIETPTREDLARLDKHRKNKASNEDWEHPHDPDARIARMKDGRTHLAHKAEHAVDLETGAVVAVTLQPADRGDPSSLEHTIQQVDANVVAVMTDDAACDKLSEQVLREVVADKGYHSNDVLTTQREREIRTYISEPDRGRRNWKGASDEETARKSAARDATYGNRRRIRGARGKRLMRRRGERVERSFAHCYDTGGMRRTHLWEHPNILKRLLIHAAGFNSPLKKECASLR